MWSFIDKNVYWGCKATVIATIGCQCLRLLWASARLGIATEMVVLCWVETWTINRRWLDGYNSGQIGHSSSHFVLHASWWFGQLALKYSCNFKVQISLQIPKPCQANWALNIFSLAKKFGESFNARCRIRVLTWLELLGVHLNVPVRASLAWTVQ